MRCSPAWTLGRRVSSKIFPLPLSSPLGTAPLTIVLGHFPMRTARRKTWRGEIERRRQPWEIFRHLKSLRLCQGQNYQSLIRSLTWTSPVERLSRPREFRKGGCGHSDSHRGAKFPLYYTVRPFASSAWHRSRALIVGPGESSIWSLVGLFLSISPVSLALLPAPLSDLE